MPNIDPKALWQTFNLTNAPSLITGIEYSYESLIRFPVVFICLILFSSRPYFGFQIDGILGDTSDGQLVLESQLKYVFMSYGAIRQVRSSKIARICMKCKIRDNRILCKTTFTFHFACG